jgi:hypothetical protein
VTINVGFDFDEPIFKWYDLAHKASLKAGIALPEHEPTGWAPHETYGCALEEWVAVLDNEILSGDMYHQPFDPDALASVKKVYRNGYDVHIITARGSFGSSAQITNRIKRVTKSEIIKQGLPYTTLTFEKDKVPVAKRLDLDYMLDDAPHNFWPLLEAGVNVFLLDERWNREDTTVTPYREGNIPAPGDPAGRRVFSTREYCDLILYRHGDKRRLTLPQADLVR